MYYEWLFSESFIALDDVSAIENDAHKRSFPTTAAMRDTEVEHPGMPSAINSTIQKTKEAIESV